MEIFTDYNGYKAWILPPSKVESQASDYPANLKFIDQSQETVTRASVSHVLALALKTLTLDRADTQAIERQTASEPIGNASSDASRDPLPCSTIFGSA